jgi:hypothetical protein
VALNTINQTKPIKLCVLSIQEPNIRAFLNICIQRQNILPSYYCMGVLIDWSFWNHHTRILLADRPSKIGADPIFVAVVTKKKFLFCICGKSGFVLFRFDPYFIVTGTCPRFSEVLVYSVQLSGKSIEMIRINQCLLSSCRLLHVARDSGVGRLVMSSTACGKRQRSGETCHVVYCMW